MAEDGLVGETEAARPILCHALGLDESYARAMEVILRASGFDGRGTVLDYGCARGQWASALSATCARVIGADVQPGALERARAGFAAAGVENATFVDLNAHALEDLPPIDAVTCMDVLPLMAGRDIHALFRFARERLESGHPFLCTTRNPKLVLDWLVTFERVRYEGVGGAARKYASLANQALRAFARRPVAPVPSARYVVFPEATVALARTYGFALVKTPAMFRAMEETRVCEPVYAGRNRLFRHIDWYLFART